MIQYISSVLQLYTLQTYPRSQQSDHHMSEACKHKHLKKQVSTLNMVIIQILNMIKVI